MEFRASHNVARAWAVWATVAATGLVALGGCDLVFGLERPTYAAGAVYAARTAFVDSDTAEDLVILDRSPGQGRVHILYGSSPFADSRVVELSFRPLAVDVTTIGSTAFVIVVGDEGGEGRIAVLRVTGRELEMTEPKVNAGTLRAVLAVPSNPSQPLLRIALVVGTRAVVTDPFALDEPNIELATLDDSLDSSVPALTFRDGRIWVVDDDHASYAALDLDQPLGDVTRVTYPAAPADVRAISGGMAFAGGDRISIFSAGCIGDACTLTWHALSPTDPVASADQLISRARVLSVVFGEFGAGYDNRDVALLGLQADGDAGLTFANTNYYDGTTFAWTTAGHPELFVDACVGGDISAMTPLSQVRIVLIDVEGRGHVIDSGVCTSLVFELTR